MENVTIKVYEFNELNEDAKQNALNDFISDSYAIDIELDYYTEEIEKHGFEDIEINFRHSYSQGDGLSFTAKNFDFEKYLKAEITYKVSPFMRAFFKNYISVSVYRTMGSYYHENTCNTDFTVNINQESDNKTPKLDIFLEDFERWIEETRYNLCISLFKDLQKDIDEQQSMEHYVQICDINEYRFLENGDLY